MKRTSDYLNEIARQSDLFYELTDKERDALKKCLLSIYIDVKSVCDKYGLTLMLGGGSVLGAVRHKGFIPWDDDMDISMKREDYEKFLKIAPGEFPKDYTILNYRNQQEYWDVMSRVLNAEFVCLDPEFLDQYHNCPYASGVDIFTLDYGPRD